MGFMAMETTCRPRSSPHLRESVSFMNVESSSAWAGRALGRTSSSEMRAKAGCSALMNSVLSMLSIDPAALRDEGYDWDAEAYPSNPAPEPEEPTEP